MSSSPLHYDDNDADHGSDDDGYDQDDVTATEPQIIIKQRPTSSEETKKLPVAATTATAAAPKKMTQNLNAFKRSKKDHPSAATQDAKLKQFLSNADEIESVEHFVYWKDEFLKTFRRYLDPVGTATAREADEEIYYQLEKLARFCLDVKSMLAQGDAITPERCSVKGQRSINEMISTLQTVEDQIMEYWPKTQEEEEKCGYTKFELAAVLVRDGFRVYGLMVATRDYVQSMSQGKLQKILKSNQLSIIQYYFRCLDSFTQTMADLGMYKLMTKCAELYKIRPRAKKKKRYSKASGGDALSDSTMSDDANKGRMFQHSKYKTKSIIDRGWTSGVTRRAVEKPWDPDGSLGLDAPPKERRGKGAPNYDNENDEDAMNGDKRRNNEIQVQDDETDHQEDDPDNYIYYFDLTHQIVAKVPRALCLQGKILLTVHDEENEAFQGEIKEWDGKKGDDDNKTMGKTELIWKLKELLRGKAKTKAEGLLSPPSSPRKKKNNLLDHGHEKMSNNMK